MANISRSRKSGFTLRNGVLKRETLWSSAVETRTTLGVASTAVILSSLGAAGLALRPFTVVRSRGVLFIQSDQAAANEFQTVAYGECVVSDQALAIGVTAVPTPVTDSISDLWFMYQWNVAAGENAAESGSTGNFVEFDSKAMRKVEDGSDLIGVVETGTLSNGVLATVISRNLIKLH